MLSLGVNIVGITATFRGWNSKTEKTLKKKIVARDAGGLTVETSMDQCLQPRDPLHMVGCFGVTNVHKYP